MNIAAYLVAGLVIALVLGIWLHAITVWLFVHGWADMIAPLVPYLFLGSFFSLLLLALWILGGSHPASGEHAMTRAQLRGFVALLLVVAVAIWGFAFVWWLLWLAKPVFGFLACRSRSATSRSHHASLAMNIVRLMVFFVLGLLLGTLLPSLVT